MRRFITFMTFLLLLASCRSPTSTPIVPTETPVSPTETSIPSTPTPEPTSTPEISVTLRRGINFGIMLESPNEGDWGLFVQEEYFDLVKEAGFDFVRLPVRWNAHAGQDPPYTLGTIFPARVDEMVSGLVR